MRLTIRLDGAGPRRWHVLLLSRLAALPGIAVAVEARPGPGGLPPQAATLFALEALIGRLPAGGPAEPVEPGTLAPFSGTDDAAPDLTLDLCGDVPDRPGTRVWRLAFDGRTGEAALLASLLAGRSPVATLTESGRVVAAGRLGTESRGVMRASFEDGLLRAVTLVAAALSGTAPALATAELVAAPPGETAALTPTALGARAVRMLAWSVVRRLYYLCYRAPHWRVGWRHLAGPDLIDLRAHPATGWRDLPDDGHRFYADPFPLATAGRTILFVEDYEHARGKAVISAVAFGPDGPVGAPVPVLDEPYHLSYPFVFERGGETWMVPESCAAGTIDLYRATAFPGGWVKEATLVSGVVASDATLLEHAGRWWLFATVRDSGMAPGIAGAGGSFSDALHLWSAPGFRGPWTPHAANPVLIDIASARPAGRIVSRGGTLIRPVQDCRLGYGDALALARIDRLDEGGYAQTVETILRAGPGWPGRRLHTLNSTDAFEFVDGSGRAPRWRLSRPAA